MTSIDNKEDVEASTMTHDEVPGDKANHTAACAKHRLLALALLSLIFALVLILSIMGRPRRSVAQATSAYPESYTIVGDSHGTRNLSTPSIRLAGRWRQIGYYNSELYFSPIEAELGIGAYRIGNHGEASFGQPRQFRILREHSSGTELIYREFKPLSIKRLELETGLDLTKSDVRCCVSKDGSTMTLEYTTGGDPDPTLSVYQYVNNEPLEK